jgi:hypothetical protein
MQFLLKYATKLFLLLLLAAASFNSFGQNKKSGEIGVVLGGSYYMGELNKTPFVGTKLSAGAFYRHTFDTRFAVNGNFTYGKLAGNSENTNFDNAAIQSFTNPFYELGGIAEFNFIPFLPGNKKYFSTPYVFAGLAETYYPAGRKKFLLNIPFGVGFKYNLNTNFILAAHMAMHKTFNDDIDYFYAPRPSDHGGDKQWGYAANKDWYSVFGVTLSYKIKYRVKCPAFD